MSKSCIFKNLVKVDSQENR